MEPRHIAPLAAIEQLCFSQPWSEAALTEECGKGLFLVAELDGKTLHPAAASPNAASPDIIGYIGCQVVLDEGYITNVAVTPAYRRRGVGRALVARLLAEAKQRGLAFVTLEVRGSNAAAIALYQQMGFVAVGKRPRFYSHPTEDALLLTRFLP